MTYQKEALQKTVRLLNICAQECGKAGFNPRELSRQIKTCNATFYDAVALGMFTKLGIGNYQANQEYFNTKDAKKISDYRKTKTSRIRYNANQTEIARNLKDLVIPIQDAQYHINALKEMGYTGVIEKKQVINF
jgi:hypothetical protein